MPDSSPRGCFVAGTPLVLADGSTVPIEQVQPGDRVLARAPEDGKGDTVRASREEPPRLVAKRVLRAFEREVDETLVLTFAGGGRVETTADHPFSVAGRGFVEAGKLGIGKAFPTDAGPRAANNCTWSGSPERSVPMLCDLSG